MTMLLDHHTPELNRPFFTRVRPLHRETLDSFSSRLLAANLEDDRHRRHLLATAKSASPSLTEEERWERVVTVKARLDPHHFSRASDSGLHHADGSSCPDCTTGIGERWMCTLCSHGAGIQQYAHFDNNLCLKHSRWTGPGTTPDDQRPTSPAHHRAEATFRRLVRRRGLDAVFYMRIRDALRESEHETGSANSTQDTDFAAYPLLIEIAEQVTDPDFLQEFLDTRLTYADAYSKLAEMIESVTEDQNNTIVRVIWLHMRSTFLSVREYQTAGGPFARSWAHDFPIPPAVIARLGTATNGEPFREYLRASGDFALTHSNWRAVQIHHANPPKHPGTNRRSEDDIESICVQGHRITRPLDFVQQFVGAKADTCRVCAGRTLLSGYNDIVTRYPRLGREFHPVDNNGTDPRDVLAGSSTKFNWRCSASGHLFSASPANRIHSDLGCPICANRVFVSGQNDLQTIRPTLSREWHPTLNPRKPAEVPVGSPDKAWWICERDHVWEALISSRVRGTGCPTCSARKVRSNSNNFAKAHPALALEWDTALNGSYGPEDVAARSNERFFWKCASGHSYSQTPDRRATGAGCPFCSRRQVSLNETDVATLYPLIANDWNCAANLGVSPRQILPGTKLYNWLCRHGHETRQSVPHRVISNGCIRCPKELRSGFVGKY